MAAILLRLVEPFVRCATLSCCADGPATTSCSGVRQHAAHPCPRPARRVMRASPTVALRPPRFAVLLRVRTGRDFVSRRSAYTPHPASLRPSYIHIGAFGVRT
jgi:hypothetical protein